jgi:hypothetical protein
MQDPNGRFVWYELMTHDAKAARAFYRAVIGWGEQDAGMPGMDYWMFTQGGQTIGGVMDMPETARAMGAPPAWTGYVAVADVDATAAAAAAKGGTVHVPPTDIPGVGRFAVIADPQGAALAIFTSSNPGQDQPAASNAPGRVGWHELYALDGATAFDFYGKLFGWVKMDAMDMGPMGTYQIFGTADTMLGGMMTKPPNVPVACWQYYFNVGNIDEAAARVTAAGGQVLHGPTDVPGGGWILLGRDPQGAMFALLGSR